MGKHKVLIGFMGSGKSSVARMLASRLGRRLVDTDAEIEREQGMTVSEIFAQRGEEEFRKLEHALLQRLARENEPLVISTGGGLAAQPRNRQALSDLGTVIYLQVQPRTVLARLRQDKTRPLLQGADKEERVRTLLAAREPLYRAAADICIETDTLTPGEIVAQILGMERSCEKSRLHSRNGGLG